MLLNEENKLEISKMIHDNKHRPIYTFYQNSTTFIRPTVSTAPILSFT